MIEDNGFKAQAGDAESLANHCISLLKDSGLQKMLAKRSLEIVKKYDVAKLTDTLESTYLSVIKNGSRRK